MSDKVSKVLKTEIFHSTSGTNGEIETNYTEGQTTLLIATNSSGYTGIPFVYNGDWYLRLIDTSTMQVVPNKTVTLMLYLI